MFIPKAALAGLISIILCVSMQNAKAQTLASRVSGTVGPPSWSYTLSNDESANSANYITSFNLSVSAPVTVTSTPAGWDYQTDNLTYVYWFNTDPTLPYPNDIAPGASLGGFTIQSAATLSTMHDFGLSGWDHSADAPGPTFQGLVLAPSVAATPAPSALVTVLIGAIPGVMLLRRRRK